MCLSASVKPFRSTAARPCAASALGDIAGTEPRCRSRSSSARQLRSKRPGGLRRRQDRQHGSPAPIPAAGRPLAVTAGPDGDGWQPGAATSELLPGPDDPAVLPAAPGTGNGEPRPARSRSPPDQRAREPSSTRPVLGVGAGPRWGHLPAVPGPASLASSSRPVPPMGQRPAARPVPPRPAPLPPRPAGVTRLTAHARSTRGPSTSPPRAAHSRAAPRGRTAGRAGRQARLWAARGVLARGFAAGRRLRASGSAPGAALRYRRRGAGGERRRGWAPGREAIRAALPAELRAAVRRAARAVLCRALLEPR